MIIKIPLIILHLGKYIFKKFLIGILQCFHHNILSTGHFINDID